MIDLNTIFRALQDQLLESMSDVDRQVRMAGRTAEAAARAVRDRATESAHLPVNHRFIEPPVMELRPYPAPGSRYVVDWHNVYRVEQHYRSWPERAMLFTRHGSEEPGADCVVSLLRADCVGLLRQRDVPRSGRPYRLWLWRGRTWQAVEPGNVTVPELWRWCLRSVRSKIGIGGAGRKCI